ncbi:MAG TPA: hypothetical protein VGX68_02310 [Thermoanaerobaculia bacterium]|jgi:hypothetical protein|nr:hypothetical protein [Thermoanaerobaculia bacterium]
MPRLRKLSAFTLALALTASGALAKPRQKPEPPRQIPASAATEDVFSRLLGWLGGLWTKEGCVIDPSGQCKESSGTTVAPPDSHVDAGCGIDPNGGPCAGGQ